VRYQAGDTADLARCVVSSGPTDLPQAQTALAVNDEVRPIIDWALGTSAAFSVDDAARAFPDCEPGDLETLFAWLSHAALIRPLPAPEWQRP